MTNHRLAHALSGAVKRRKALDLVVLVAATAVTRIVFRSHYLYDIDSVNFALALHRYDPSSHQPHPPGYFLYVLLGRLVNLIYHDANVAFVAISIVFSCAAVAMIYVLTEGWFGRNAALFSGLIFLFSPLAWFHGTVALTYIVEAFFSALVGYLCWRIYCGAARYVLPAALALGIAAGFRPSSALFLCPLFWFSLRRVGWKQLASGTGLLLLTSLAWFIPMARIGGGSVYASSLLSLWLTVPSRESFFNSSVLNALARALVIVGIGFLSFGCAVLLPLQRTRQTDADDGRKATFTLVWIMPGLLFFVFIYLKFVNSGYLLILLPPGCSWMGVWAADWYASLPLARARKILLVGCCALANAAIFVFAPVYCSYGEVRRFERELGEIVSALPQIAPAEMTMIVGLDSHFLGYRHAGYYLPAYLTVQFPEVQLAMGKRVFAMRNQDTRLRAQLAAGSIREFIIFPLPAGDPEYSRYMALVRGRFPPGDLRLVVRDGHEFALGPIEDLHFLFPVCAPLPNGGVYGK